MNIATVPRNLYQNWQFAIEINGFDVALFQKSSLPKTEFEEVTFAPAGSLFDQKVAGRMKFDDLTLEKGILADGSDDAARQWLQQVGAATLGMGGTPPPTTGEASIRSPSTGGTGRRTPSRPAPRWIAITPMPRKALLPSR
jgi:hypothetical protein